MKRPIIIWILLSLFSVGLWSTLAFFAYSALELLAAPRQIEKVLKDLPYKRH